MKLGKNLSLYMFGRFISYIGTGIQQIAMPLYILDVTNSSMAMGIFSAINIVPNIITLPFAGILGDKKNRKNIIIASDFLRALFILFLSYLAICSTLTIYTLFLVQALVSVMDSIFLASSTAILPELIPPDSIEGATSLRASSDAVSMIIGPCIGGILYGIFGIKAIFLLNGLSFMISGISSFFINYKNNSILDSKITIKSFFKESNESIKFIRQNSALSNLFIFFMITNLIVAPFIDVVFPYILKGFLEFDSTHYSYLISLFTVGILFGNIALSIFFKKFSNKYLIQGSLILETAALIITAVFVSPSMSSYTNGASLKLFLFLGISILLCGLFTSGINTPITVNFQKMVPNQMRSRFFAVLGIACQISIPVGSLFYGFVLARFFYEYVLAFALAIFLVSVIVFILKAPPDAYDSSI